VTRRCGDGASTPFHYALAPRFTRQCAAAELRHQAAHGGHTEIVHYTAFGMWRILEHRRIDHAVASIPDEILMRYEKWKDIVSLSGPGGLRQIKGFHDEALRGEWKGHRSSRLGLKYRVIYRVEKDTVEVYVIDLTAHDYRRK
jgi:addiction module RelE/StbE family toxin